MNDPDPEVRDGDPLCGAANVKRLTAEVDRAGARRPRSRFGRRSARRGTEDGLCNGTSAHSTAKADRANRI
jgi:hypothetical protein